jgi:hypothetical protein
LIWINYPMAEIIDFGSVTMLHRPLIRRCPLCGVAVKAGKSQENLADFDTFRCLACDTTIREAKSPPRPARNVGKEGGFDLAQNI